MIGSVLTEKGENKMAKYRKKPVVIEAVQFTANDWHAARDFVGSAAKETPEGLVIHTLEGDMLASLNDYIIKGVDGEFYPCKPDIFEKTYEPVTD